MKPARAELDVQVVRHERIDPARRAEVLRVLKRILDKHRQSGAQEQP